MRRRRERINLTVDPEVRSAARAALGGDRGLSPLFDRLLDEWLRAGVPTRFAVIDLGDYRDEHPAPDDTRGDRAPAA